MFNIVKKAVENHISLFEGLNYERVLTKSFDKDDVYWDFSISVSKISKKWYIHYTNRIIDRSGENIETIIFDNDGHHKNNLIHSMFKKDYNDYFDDFNYWQGKMIENYKINFVYSENQCLDELKKLVDKECEDALNY
jgi:hypothetical protein